MTANEAVMKFNITFVNTETRKLNKLYLNKKFIGFIEGLIDFQKADTKGILQMYFDCDREINIELNRKYIMHIKNAENEKKRYIFYNTFLVFQSADKRQYEMRIEWDEKNNAWGKAIMGGSK